MQDYSKWPKCKVRGDVDNIVGHLYNHVRYYFPMNVETLESFKFEEFGSKIFIDNCAVPKELAKRVKRFLKQIPFDETAQQINDKDNPPQDKIRTLFKDPAAIEHALKKPICDPLQWKWERYSEDIFRATPLSGESFVGSPIMELFDYLSTKFHQTTIDGLKCSDVKRACWVIQRITKNHELGIHVDDCGHRAISFVYYLTSKSWDTKTDGGALYFELNKNKDIYVMNPSFNRLVTWNLKTTPCLPHGVSKVSTDKPRLSLVGFYGY